MAAQARDCADKPLQIVVNGEPLNTNARNLAALLSELGYADQRVATALDGEFVAAKDRAARALAPGDRIEIVAPRQGG